MNGRHQVCSHLDQQVNPCDDVTAATAAAAVTPDQHCYLRHHSGKDVHNKQQLHLPGAVQSGGTLGRTEAGRLPRMQQEW